MVSSTKLRIGLIGAGMIAREHLAGILKHPNATLVSVADINAASANELAQLCPEPPRVFTDYKSMLASVPLDAVVVCTPPWLHEEMTIAALEAGVHVLCEKPHSTNLASAERMVEAGKKSGKVLADCSSRYLFSPILRDARSAIESGIMGDIYYVRYTARGSFVRPGIEYNPGAVWFLDKSKAGGGVLLDWGVYDLAITLTLLGYPALDYVMGFTYTGMDNSKQTYAMFDVEEHGAATLRTANGILIQWEHAWAAHMQEQSRLQIFGSRAGLAFSPVQWDRPRTMEIIRRSYTETNVQRITTKEEDIYLNPVSDFIDALVEGREPAMPAEKALVALRTIFAIYESQATGAPVSLRQGALAG
jgi:predicted dehydrogenase